MEKFSPHLAEFLRILSRAEFFLDNAWIIYYNYKYNDHGQVIEIRETDLNGVLLRTNTFAYDSKKRLAATTYGAVGQTYRPIYDKNAGGHEYPDNEVMSFTSSHMNY